MACFFMVGIDGSPFWICCDSKGHHYITPRKTNVTDPCDNVVSMVASQIRGNFFAYIPKWLVRFSGGPVNLEFKYIAVNRTDWLSGLQFDGWVPTPSMWTWWFVLQILDGLFFSYLVIILFSSRPKFLCLCHSLAICFQSRLRYNIGWWWWWTPSLTPCYSCWCLQNC